jgi:hypothetical protein
LLRFARNDDLAVPTMAEQGSAGITAD